MADEVTVRAIAPGEIKHVSGMLWSAERHDPIFKAMMPEERQPSIDPVSTGQGGGVSVNKPVPGHASRLRMAQGIQRNGTEDVDFVTIGEPVTVGVGYHPCPTGDGLNAGTDSVDAG